MDTKSTFKGRIISIQPRIRLMRSFDEASHTYLGYAITVMVKLFCNTKYGFLSQISRLERC